MLSATEQRSSLPRKIGGMFLHMFILVDLLSNFNSKRSRFSDHQIDPEAKDSIHSQPCPTTCLVYRCVFVILCNSILHSLRYRKPNKP